MDEESPQLFRHLQLADDGGLKEEAGCLYHHGRLVGSVSSLGVICMNVANLIRVDLKILSEARNNIGVDRLNLTEIILRAAGWRHAFFAEQLVAYFELVVLFLLLATMVVYAIRGIYDRRRSRRFERWLCTACLFQAVLPELQHFSAMRTLEHVQPYLAKRELKALIADAKDRREQGERPMRLWFDFLLFIVTRVLIFIFGFDAFVVKFRVAAESAHVVSFSGFLRILLFLNQMLGVVSLEHFTRLRLYQFVFGGEDNIISAGEERLLSAWTAKLYERIWTVPTTTPVRSFAVSLTFNDEDFQRLMLNEQEIDVSRPPIQMVNALNALSETEVQKSGGRVHRLSTLFGFKGRDQDVSPSDVAKRHKTSPALFGSRKGPALPAPVPRVVGLGTL